MLLQIVTLFPAMVRAVLAESIIGRAQRAGIVEVRVVNLRDFAVDSRGTVDDAPFGGGPGMVLRPEPIFNAVEALAGDVAKVIYLTPQGRRFSQKDAVRLARHSHLLFLCGHYEGMDERVRRELVDEEISIGDFVLTNGTIPALVVADAVIRLLPGALGDARSAASDSHGEDGLLEHPQYTRPAEFRGMKVPDVLLSGDHVAVARWRGEQSRIRTTSRRPDLILNAYTER